MWGLEMARWDIEHRPDRTTVVLPAGLRDSTEMIEVTRVGDRFARFFTIDGRHIDCAEFAEQYRQEVIEEQSK